MSTGLSLKQAAGQADQLCPGFLTDPNAFKDDYCRTVRSLIRSLAQDTDTTQQLGDPNMGFAHSAAATGVDGVDGAGAVVINKQLLKHYDDLERDGRARSIAGKARGLSTSQFTLDVRAHNAAQTAAYETQLAQYMTDMTAWAAAGVALAAWNAVAANAAAIAAAAPGVAPPGQPAAPGNQPVYPEATQLIPDMAPPDMHGKHILDNPIPLTGISDVQGAAAYEALRKPVEAHTKWIRTFVHIPEGTGYKQASRRNRSRKGNAQRARGG